MTVEAFDVEDELRRLVEEGRITPDAVQAVTGISGDALVPLLREEPRTGDGLTAVSGTLSNDESGRLSTLVVQLVESSKPNDDERVRGMIESLTRVFQLSQQNIALLTGVDVGELESFVQDPAATALETKYQLAVRVSYLVNAIGSALPRAPQA
jgi:hypothetical protein